MQNEVKYWYLRNYGLFSDLRKEQIHDLCSISRFIRMKKGQTIYFANDESKRLYFLINGKIKISEVDGLGNEMIKDIILTGDLFGEIPITNFQVSQEFAEILSREVILCTFTMDEFEKLMHKHPILALSFSKKMGEKLRRLEHRYANLVFKDVKARLKDFLVDWANKEGKPLDDGLVIKNYLTHHEIASLISSSRQTVTTLINELKEEGVIVYSRSLITIPNMGELAA
ncbi:MAG: CRP/FNR family cyclic AMP-dependent transcriptional regulator [Parvicella sp.]|jgi:CRP/FNR family cyclic AMP-dependent transcriptional regulator